MLGVHVDDLVGVELLLFRKLCTLNFVEVSVGFSGCSCKEIHSCRLPLESCKASLGLNDHDLLSLDKLMREAKSMPDLPSAVILCLAHDCGLSLGKSP